ncbi:MAG: hypothetical protein O7H41_14970 [Planctomycetota bacterium]|nr:hypothetical protein [Planctomycetota bacterium]
MNVMLEFPLWTPIQVGLILVLLITIVILFSLLGRLHKRLIHKP